MLPQNLSTGSLDFHHHLPGNNFTEAEMYSLQPNYGGGVSPTGQRFCSNNNYYYNTSSSSSLFNYQPIEIISEVTDSNPEAKALAASHHHKEAERRRRERINGHLDRLRSLLPCNSKTDKASLLAKVVERVKELKQETSKIIQQHDNNYLIPSETDEITVFNTNRDDDDDDDDELIIEASLSCEDRSELIPELIELMKNLNLRPVRAEMVTLGGRIRNVMIVTSVDKEDQSHHQKSVSFFRDALRSLVHRSNYGHRTKRPRVFDQDFVSN